MTDPGQSLVETAWLQAHLDDPDVRVLDCTVFFSIDGNGFRIDSGHDAWTRGHIPGSGFADVMKDLSDPNNPVPFMMAPAAQFTAAMSRYGAERDRTDDLLARMARERAPLINADRHGRSTCGRIGLGSPRLGSTS